jgi:hypothetical protein
MPGFASLEPTSGRWRRLRGFCLMPVVLVPIPEPHAARTLVISAEIEERYSEAPYRCFQGCSSAKQVCLSLLCPMDRSLRWRLSRVPPSCEGRHRPQAVARLRLCLAETQMSALPHPVSARAKPFPYGGDATLFRFSSRRSLHRNSCPCSDRAQRALNRKIHDQPRTIRLATLGFQFGKSSRRDMEGLITA